MTRANRILENLRNINEPPNLIDSFAEKSGKSKSEVEKLWNKAEEVAKEEYPDVDQDSDRFYKIVTGILKNMLNIK